MPRLVLEIIRLSETEISMKVLEQDNSLRKRDGSGAEKWIVGQIPGFELISWQYPSLQTYERTGICIRGTDSFRDNDVTTRNFYTREECDKYLEKLKLMLKHVNGKDSRFKE